VEIGADAWPGSAAVSDCALGPRALLDRRTFLLIATGELSRSRSEECVVMADMARIYFRASWCDSRFPSVRHCRERNGR
jgi:hypothetical protein